MATPAGRKPLIAGNWKMNLTHLEAIALVQKVSFGLREREAEAVEVAVLPPFTSIRSRANAPAAAAGSLSRLSKKTLARSIAG